MCDGLFLILDTAKHNGFEPDPKEIVDHMSGCDECIADDAAYGDWAEAIFDPDSEPWDTLKEVDGHA